MTWPILHSPTKFRPPRIWAPPPYFYKTESGWRVSKDKYGMGLVRKEFNSLSFKEVNTMLKMGVVREWKKSQIVRVPFSEGRLVIWLQSWNVFACAPVAGCSNSTRDQQGSESCELATYLGPCVYTLDSCSYAAPPGILRKRAIAFQCSLPVGKKGTVCWRQSKTEIPASQGALPEELSPRGRGVRCCWCLEREGEGRPSLQVLNCHLVWVPAIVQLYPLQLFKSLHFFNEQKLLSGQFLLKSENLLYLDILELKDMAVLQGKRKIKKLCELMTEVPICSPQCPKSDRS